VYWPIALICVVGAFASLTQIPAQDAAPSQLLEVLLGAFGK
jgi:hypothetical protein